MRTSNKILLTVFLATVLMFTGVHLALYAKFKMGRYKLMGELYKDQLSSYELKKSRYIVATGIENLRIMPSDTFRIEIEKEGFVNIKYEVKGDSLVIHGDSTMTQSNGQIQNRRSSRMVNLLVPGGESIVAVNSEVYLQGTTDSAKRASYQFILSDESNFHLMENNWKDSATRYFDQINIKAGHSGINLTGFAQITNLSIDLQNSNFDDKDAWIDKLNVNSDNFSAINLSGRNLRNLNKQ